jgi:rhodanese-related sulfurtransferase
VDTRAGDDRLRDGAIPGALRFQWTVVEWKLDPASPWRAAAAPGLDDEVILVCSHGYSSSLAAATLVELGYTRAGDVVGGFEAWEAAGLPVEPA